MHAAALSVHAIGAALTAASDLNKKHAVKQVDRMLSNAGIVMAEVFPVWAEFVLSGRKARIALEWTDFDKDGQVTFRLMLCSRSRWTG